jgi:cytochrome b pre-mRNA-processing protein 3
MLGLLKKPPKLYKQQAEIVYSKVTEASRNEAFFKSFDITDDFDGRFEVLCLYSYLAMAGIENCLERASRVTQKYFNLVFKDIEYSLREIGVGDLGVPKHMKRMMKGFNGRYHSYEDGLLCYKVDKSILIEALRRNIYGTRETVDIKTVERLADYVANTFEAVLSHNEDAYSQKDSVLFAEYTAAK